MRASDRDLVREGHYGQRSCKPRKQAEHMAAPTNSANVKISLANSEPSIHGTKQTSGLAQPTSDFKRTVEIHPTFIRRCEMSDDEPKRILDKHTGALFLS